MLRFLLAALLLFAGVSHAQAQQTLDPEKGALSQMVMEGIQREAALRAKLITSEAELAKAKQAPNSNASKE